MGHLHLSEGVWGFCCLMVFLEVSWVWWLVYLVVVHKGIMLLLVGLLVLRLGPGYG